MGMSARAADLYVPDEENIYELSSRCAVSGVNGKIEAAGGYVDTRAGDGGRVHVLGSIAGPIGCQLGYQIDAGIGDFAGSTSGGIAGHLFLRDPTSHLFGVYGQWGAVGSDDVWRIGLEGEKYLGNISLEALFGYEDVDRSKGDVFAAFDLAYYNTEDVRLSVGYHRFFKTDAVAVGLEWQTDGLGFSNRPFSLFANAALGDRGYGTVLAGVRFYFGGPDKSLIRRHREDDPGAKGIFQLLSENASGGSTVTPAAAKTTEVDVEAE